jgi:kinesin family protein 3/17
MQTGESNRSMGATLMNETSSRAPTITMIEFIQKIQHQGKKAQKVSQINLVDLAGSEKVDQTGAVGDRLKEATLIN